MRYFYKDNPTLQAAVDGFFAELEQYNQTQCNGRLSVILLGSLSRGEATWIETESGFVMVSDIEFFTVYDAGFTGFAAFKRAIDEAARHHFTEQRSVLFHVDNTFVCRQRLATMERKLLTYDAKQMGKTVVGRDAVCFLPEIDLTNINLWDIRDILTHRTFAVLYYGLPLKEQGETEQYRYCLAKNSLDLMTVLLACHGQLASGFINRLELVRQLPIDKEIKAYFEYCLSIKLSSECSYAYTVEQMEERFVSLVRTLKKQFRVPLKNTLTNRKHVTRRVLGMCKRTLLHKHIVMPGHLHRLIAHLTRQEELKQRHLRDNLVLNGYPEI